MRKLLCLLCLCSLLAVSAQATPIQSLGSWFEGDASTTHQFWDFTPGHVTAISGDGYSATPDSVFSPTPLSVVASISPGTTWDGVTQFVSTHYISVNMELPNYLDRNVFKEIWVDIGNNIVNPLDISVSATPTDIPFTYEILAGQGDAEFGVRIYPNPDVEKVGFTIFGTTNNPVVLDYIHVDTICPEPATIGMLSLGVLSLIRRKK